LNNYNKEINGEIEFIVDRNNFKLVRPWKRCLARLMDIILFEFLCTLVLVFVKFPLVDVPDILYAMSILFIWVFVEAILLSTIGTTPGKWFFNIELKVLDSGKPSFKRAINRSFSVWFYGLCAGMPILSLLACIIAFLDLEKNAITIWDAQYNFTISNKWWNDGDNNDYARAFVVMMFVLGAIFLKIYKVVQ